MKFYVRTRKNPSTREVQYHPQGIKTGIIDTESLSAEIAERCSLTAGDVLNVLQNLYEIIPKYLIEGYTVKLNSLGTFHLTLLTEGTTTADDCTGKKVKRAAVHCIADKQLRQKVNNAITYEKVPKPTDKE